VDNNDILRRIRYTFAINDQKMLAIFALAGQQLSREQVNSWLRKDDDPEFSKCSDADLTLFLDGFISEHRGKKEGAPPPLEERLTNNTVFRKLKIALDLKAEDVLEILALSGVAISKHELSAFFRKIGHKHYRECKDQILRNFINGLQIKYRASPTDSDSL